MEEKGRKGQASGGQERTAQHKQLGRKSRPQGQTGLRGRGGSGGRGERPGDVPVTEGRADVQRKARPPQAGAASEGHSRLFVFGFWGCECFSPRKASDHLVLLPLFSIQRKVRSKPQLIKWEVGKSKGSVGRWH